jgi:hypothetical protein
VTAHREIGWLLAAVVGISICAVDPIDQITLGGREAHAVVGRPVTPVSYAGVARRTTRRTVRRTAAATSSTTVVQPVQTLPDDCTQTGGSDGTVQYTCGSSHYQPYYDGANVVYEQVD